MITKEEIIAWLMEGDEYSEEEATQDVKEATIQNVTLITYNNGVRDVIYKDENGNIIHVNAYGNTL